MAESVPLWEIFGVMFLAGVFAFGGGSQVPFIQGQWVPGALSPDLFSLALGVTYLTPGPKAGFVAGIGYYLGGVPGAVVASAGLILPTIVGTASASYAAARMRPLVELLTPSAGFIIAALIAAAAWGIARPMDLGPLELVAALVAAVLVAWRNIDPVWLIAAAMVSGLVWSLVLFLG